jgi:hypothetical protein
VETCPAKWYRNLEIGRTRLPLERSLQFGDQFNLIQLVPGATGAGMNSIAVTLVLCSAISAVPTDIAKQLSDAGIRRVGVVPRTLQRVGGHEVVAEQLGPQSELVPQQLSKDLADVSATDPFKGKLSVVNHRVMRSAFGKLSPEDLGDLKALQRIGQETGANALLVVFVADKQDAFSYSCELVPVSGDEARGVDITWNAVKSIADFAYMGGSFEARRWVKDELVPVGLKAADSAPAKTAPFSLLKLEQPHPLQQKNFPYGFEVVMRSRGVQASAIDDAMYVELNEDEVYEIRVWNNGPRPVYMGLYIDGINTIGKELEGPAETPANRMWFLKPGPKPATVDGYLTIGKAGQAQQTSEQFVIAPRARSLAVQRGFADSLGMITAVVYDFIPTGKAGEKQKELPQIGTRAGKKEQIIIKEWGTGKRGELLAAMTLRYATPAEVEAIRGRSSGGKTGQGSQASLSGQSSKNSGDNGSGSKSRDPDESVPYPRSTAAGAFGLSKKP